MSGRSVTIDRARRNRLWRDIVVQALRSRSGRRRLAAVGSAAAVVGFVLFGWPTALVVALTALLGQVGWWVRAARVGMRSGLDLGQRVTVDYASSGELRLTDVTGTLWLARGSVVSVERCRSVVTVLYHQFSFLLPAELLTDADVAFLEGRSPAGPGTPLGPHLPYRLEVTTTRQRELVAAATTSVVTSADFLGPWVSGISIVALVGWIGTAAVAAGAAGVVALFLLPQLVALARTRSRFRLVYRAGGTVRAALVDDALLVSLPVGTSRLELAGFSGVRVGPGAVILALARRPFALDRNVVLPADLLDAEALATLTRRVTGRRPGARLTV